MAIDVSVLPEPLPSEEVAGTRVASFIPTSWMEAMPASRERTGPTLDPGGSLAPGGEWVTLLDHA